MFCVNRNLFNTTSRRVGGIKWSEGAYFFLKIAWEVVKGEANLESIHEWHSTQLSSIFTLTFKLTSFWNVFHQLIIQKMEYGPINCANANRILILWAPVVWINPFPRPPKKSYPRSKLYLKDVGIDTKKLSKFLVRNIL